MAYEKIKQILCEDFDIDEADIALDTQFLEDLGFDELDMADLCMSLEDIFDKELSDEVLENIVTVGDMVSYIEEN